MPRRSGWDTELYEAQHSFVWKMGEALLTILNAQPQERILDLGCGTGQLTSAIAETGATVVGLDSSADMIGQARQNFPRVQFLLQDACALNYDGEFDAVFSNAALHWIRDASTVARGIAKALRLDGRLVAEFGGRGNIARIESVIREVLAGSVPEDALYSRYYFPTIGEYASLLEEHGFEVKSIALFDRPTPLKGPNGIEQWIRQFAFHYFEPLSPSLQVRALREVVSRLRLTHWHNGVWTADYRRLRVHAVKLQSPA